MSRARKVLALSGGIGGAKLALGLTHAMPAEELTIVANIGDDFEHLGLAISPDIDTLLYTLADIQNLQQGWGRRDETWTFMRVLKDLGEPDWFQLGDGDLALHVARTQRLRKGESLSSITADVARRFGIVARIVPASDEPLRTRLETSDGWLDFQDYFVRLRCEPAVRKIIFDGVAAARPHPDIVRLLNDDDLRAVIVCPSNPFISVEPILAVSGMRDALRRTRAPVVAVSPIIGGDAVKGPTAKMMRELGLELSAAGVAARYADFLNGFVLDAVDAGLAARVAAKTTTAQTLMHDLDAKVALARDVLAFADHLTA